MGQKVNPIGLRIGVTKGWESRWFAEKDYAKLLQEDILIREIVKEKFYHAGIGKIEIERAADRAKITIFTARPGIIIGRKGLEIENLRKYIQERIKRNLLINIEEIKKPDLISQLVAEMLAARLVRRIGFRRAMKRTVQTVLKAGALGIKISCAGRLAGAEIARTEWYRQGRVPLHTLRADIDYGFTEAKTKYGTIGIKVWIFRREIFEKGLRMGV